VEERRQRARESTRTRTEHGKQRKNRTKARSRTPNCIAYPVLVEDVDDHGQLTGVDAVVDKDNTANLSNTLERLQEANTQAHM
jgi:hypothetical protein